EGTVIIHDRVEEVEPDRLTPPRFPANRSTASGGIDGQPCISEKTRETNPCTHSSKSSHSLWTSRSRQGSTECDTAGQGGGGEEGPCCRMPSHRYGCIQRCPSSKDRVSLYLSAELPGRRAFKVRSTDL